jgi:LuxR family maltose regulon positive regulatory protein
VQAPSFALTKIQPPRLRGGLVARPVLERALGDALAGFRLTLLSAPAGYGKTAALTRQLGQLPAGTAVAWVALDEDDDLARVCSCLLAALEPCDLPWRLSPEALVLALQDGTRASRQALVAALVNALAATEVPRGLLVFDDAHRIGDPAVFEWLDAVVERLPPHWGAVVASRTDPPLALAKLRAHGECAELRQEQLGFSADDVRALVRQRQPDAGDAAVASLHERTQGWPAGLGLVLSESPSRRAAQSGSVRDRHVFDYLASEVLADMPPELRRFLLRCSVLAELTVAQCRVVAEDERAAQWLEEIERRGLFASVLESEVATLRLHDLFRDCLDDLLRRESPDEVPRLLRLAASVEADPLRRMGHLLRAGDWELAERQLSELAPQLLTRGEIAALQRLTAQFPAEFRQRSPHVQLARTLAGWARWDWAEMTDAARQAAEAFGAAGDERLRSHALAYLAVALSSMDQDKQAEEVLAGLQAGPLDDEALRLVLLVSGWLALPRGDIPRMADALRRMMDTLERTQDLRAWYECSPLPSYVGLPGLREPLLRYVNGIQRRLPDQPVPPGGMAQVTRGWLHLWAGRLDDALAAVQAAQADSQWLGRPTNLHWQAHMLEAMCKALLGDEAGAWVAARVPLEESLALSDPIQRAAYVARLTYFAGRMAVIAGDDTRAGELLGRLEANRHDPQWTLSDAFRSTAKGYLACADGRFDEAIAHWREVLADEPRVDVYGQGTELRMRLAALLAGERRLDEAVVVLQPALARARPDAEFGITLAAGRRVLAQLAAAPWGTRLPADALQQLARWAAWAAGQRTSGEAAASAGANTPDRAGPALREAPDLLSPRETEVLARIAAGDSNKLIARAFDLSPHTVKRHVANILDKLGVSTRGQAAAWQREHRA